MKKVVAILLFMSMLLSFISCGADHNGDTLGKEQEKEKESTEIEEKEPVYNKPTKWIDIQEEFIEDEIEYGDGKVLPYRMYLPDGYTEDSKYPVLLFLHSADLRGNDNRNQLSYVLPTVFKDLTSPIFGSIVIVPQCPPTGQWVDVPWANGNYSVDEVPMSAPMTGVVALLDLVCALFPVDENRLYLAGNSMGGYGAWDLLARYPKKFAGALICAGAGDVSKAKDLLDIPIASFHGGNDNVVPPAGDRAMAEEFKRLGGKNFTYTEYNGLSHNVWDYVSREIMIDGIPAYTWLLTQKRK